MIEVLSDFFLVTGSESMVWSRERSSDLLHSSCILVSPEMISWVLEWHPGRVVSAHQIVWDPASYTRDISIFWRARGLFVNRISSKSDPAAPGVTSISVIIPDPLAHSVRVASTLISIDAIDPCRRLLLLLYSTDSLHIESTMRSAKKLKTRAEVPSRTSQSLQLLCADFLRLLRFRFFWCSCIWGVQVIIDASREGVSSLMTAVVVSPCIKRVSWVSLLVRWDECGVMSKMSYFL